MTWKGSVYFTTTDNLVICVEMLFEYKPHRDLDSNYNDEKWTNCPNLGHYELISSLSCLINSLMKLTFLHVCANLELAKGDYVIGLHKVKPQRGANSLGFLFWLIVVAVSA